MSIRFILNDTECSVDRSAGGILLDFLRRDRGLRGTKIGCREGDCGACTVLVGELRDGDVHYRSMTSCLMPLGNAAGKHIVTIEGLNRQELTPIQTAIAEEGATQCGFCTVGFVVSLAGFCLDRAAPSPERAIAAIDGNICRCTGYKSLERAAGRLAGELAERTEGGEVAWLTEHGFLPDYFAGIADRLQAIEVGRLAEERTAPGGRVVGGGTDLYVQRPEAMAGDQVRLFLDREQLRFIRREGDRCVVGASTTAEDMKQDPLFAEMFPRIDAYLKLVSSTPIRNMGTVAGNFVNASPIGDLTIFFLALEAILVLECAGTQREVPLRSFYRGYKTLDLAEGETVHSLHFPMPDAKTEFNFEKVSKRTHLDIASVNSAICLQVVGETIVKAGVSAGGVAPVPLFLTQTATFLKGRPLDAETAREAGRIAQGEVSPISDARGTAAYKRLLLRQLIYAHFLTLYPEAVRLEVLV